ncbi:MAG TPA: DUF4388 domain-containing protein [Ktedonobacteraceae bacterium]
MSQQPATSTDRLANVIEVIQLGRKTGMLVAERDTGLMLEQGMITFVKGQVTQASIGQHVGYSAFNLLKTWGACRFAFAPSEASQASQQITRPLPPVTDPTLHPPGMTNSRHEHSMPAGEQGRNGTGGMQSGPVPYPLRPYNDALSWIERMGLSRTHKQLFLLIDGFRSIPELARLIGRGQEEVSALLRELESAGLIRQK